MLAHGSNIAQKEKNNIKYQDLVSQAYLAEIRAKYDEWHLANTQLIGPGSKSDDSDNSIREFRFDPTYVKNPIDAETVWHLFETVRSYLTTDWENSLQHALQRGWLL